MKYGFEKIKATVSKKRIIRHARRDYYVTIGADLFSRPKSTRVKISSYRDKLYIFEPGEDSVLLGEALACQPFNGPPVTGDMRKFQEICTDCRERAKELKYQFVDINLALEFISDLPPQ